MISKRKIDNIGSVLKEQESLTDQDYQDLLEWRNSFSSILNYYHTKLKSKIDQQDG